MQTSKNLDLEACSRLAVSGSFPTESVEALKSGRLRMSPHPEWEIPETVDWSADPFDANWRFQFNMLRWLDPLRSAGEQGDLEALALWVRYARDWVTKNPPGSAQSPDAWIDMADGLRTLRLITAAPTIAKYMPSEMGWLTDSIYTHRDWLADRQNWGRANHLLHQLQGLVAAGAVTRSPDHVQLATTSMRALLSESWDNDGINAEGAISYHRANYIWWNEALDRFQAAGVPRPAEARHLELAPLSLAHATRPDGTFVTIGDTDTDSARNIDHPACRWVVSGGAEGEPPRELIKLYKAGYIYGRSGWGEFERDMAEETFFSLTFGAQKVHGHQDGGSLTFSANGVNWVVDPGKYSYSHRTPMRRHMVAHTSHSLAYISGQSRDKNKPVELQRSQIDDDSCDFLFEDYGFAPSRLLRRVIYSRSGEYLVVFDTVRAKREVELTQRWQLGPGVVATHHRQSVQLTKGNGAAHAGLFFFGRRSEIDIRTNTEGEPEGLVSIGWKRTAKAPAVLAKKTGQRERFITFLVPGHGEAPEVTLVSDIPAPALAFRVKTKRATEVILITPDRVYILPGESSTEEMIAALGKVKTSGTPEVSPFNQPWRTKVAKSIIEARQSAWETDADGRKALAQKLDHQLQERDTKSAMTLGVEAALEDLRQRSHRRANRGDRGALLNWDNSPRWEPAGIGLVGLGHRGSLGDFPVATAAMHAIDLGELVLPMAFIPGKDPFLTVDFHGALDRVRMRLPVFQGQRRERQQHSGNVLFVADPTLDLSRSLRLGWYLGTKSLDLAPHIATAIQAITEKLGVERLILRGSSGGGFAAIQVGAHIPEATVVAFNPQTDIRKYSPRHSAEAFATVYGLETAPTDPELIKRISAAERIRVLNQCPTIHYINNSQDKSHIEHHFEPFKSTLEELGYAEQLKPEFHDFGPGHRRPSAYQDAMIMQEIYRSFGFQAG